MVDLVRLEHLGSLGSFEFRFILGARIVLWKSSWRPGLVSSCRVAFRVIMVLPLHTVAESLVSMVFMINVLMNVSRLVTEREEKRKDTGGTLNSAGRPPRVLEIIDAWEEQPADICRWEVSCWNHQFFGKTDAWGLAFSSRRGYGWWVAATQLTLGRLGGPRAAVISRH